MGSGAATILSSCSVGCGHCTVTYECGRWGEIFHRKEYFLLCGHKVMLESKSSFHIPYVLQMSSEISTCQSCVNNFLPPELYLAVSMNLAIFGQRVAFPSLSLVSWYYVLCMVPLQIKRNDFFVAISTEM